MAFISLFNFLGLDVKLPCGIYTFLICQSLVVHFVGCLLAFAVRELHVLLFPLSKTKTSMIYCIAIYITAKTIYKCK